MSIDRIQTDARMSQVVVRAGVVYISGQVDLAHRGPTVAEQMIHIIARIDVLLATVNSDKTMLLSATIWLADIAQFEVMNRAWTAWLPVGDAPARATVQTKLASPSFLVEVSVVATVKSSA